MSFQDLPADVCFHLLMNEHPKDLYHVSHHIPQLRQTARSALFQRKYQAKWIDGFYQYFSNDCLVGLATFHRLSYLKNYFFHHSNYHVMQLICLVLDYQDMATAKWLLLHFHSKMTRKVDQILQHRYLTSKLRHLIYEFELDTPVMWLCEIKNKGNR